MIVDKINIEKLKSLQPTINVLMVGPTQSERGVDGTDKKKQENYYSSFESAIRK